MAALTSPPSFSPHSLFYHRPKPTRLCVSVSALPGDDEPQPCPALAFEHSFIANIWILNSNNSHYILLSFSVIYSYFVCMVRQWWIYYSQKKEKNRRSSKKHGRLCSTQDGAILRRFRWSTLACSSYWWFGWNWDELHACRQPWPLYPHWCWCHVSWVSWTLISISYNLFYCRIALCFSLLWLSEIGFCALCLFQLWWTWSPKDNTRYHVYKKMEPQNWSSCYNTWSWRSYWCVALGNASFSMFHLLTVKTNIHLLSTLLILFDIDHCICPRVFVKGYYQL